MKILSLLMLAGCLGASVAEAQTACDELPNPLYLQVGDTQEPLMKALGRALADSTVHPMTLVYVTAGSCINVQAIYEGVEVTTAMKYVPSSTEDAAWTTAMPAPTCTVPAEGQALDIANSALFVSACNPDEPPAGIELFQGPVQAYGFVVPEASTETAITAEEAYFAFGFGTDGMVAPWDDETLMFIRPQTKSTLLTMAAAIRVPGAAWHGQRLDKSSEVLSAVTMSLTPQKTIGILGVEIYDGARDSVDVLAYRAFGQRHAFFPDSTPEAFDKRNVRDGHYTPWAPTVWLTHVDDGGEPLDQDAAYLIDLILGLEPDSVPDFEPLDIVVDVGLVPDCAMRVTRSYEGGDLSLYEPAEPCGCYYDDRVATAPESCVTCSDEDPCDSGVCRHGFCEER